MPIIQAGRYRVDYVETGAGPPVVLVHSSASSHRQWFRLMEQLADRYRLLAINLFGYGATSPWPGERPLSLADEAALVEAVVGQCAEPVALVGHSLGAAVSMETAYRLGPRVRTLIAFEPILFYLLKDAQQEEALVASEVLRAEYLARAERGDWDGAGRIFVDYWSGQGAWDSMSGERRDRVREMLRPVVFEWQMLTAGRPVAAWGRIAARVHLMQAADTTLPTRAVTDILRRAHPAWDFRGVPAGGHMAPVSRADLVNPIVAGILDATYHDG